MGLPTKHCWAATARKVHLATKEKVPLCLQRHGARAKPLKRVAQGVKLEIAESLGIAFCMECKNCLR